MAYSRHIGSYPLTLVQAAEAVIRDDLTIELECDSEKEAQTLRTKFYGLRNAYLHKANESHPLHKDAGKMFATAKGKTLIMSPGSLQPLEAKYADRMAAAIEAAKAKEGN